MDSFRTLLSEIERKITVVCLNLGRRIHLSLLARETTSHRSDSNKVVDDHLPQLDPDF